MHFYDEDDEVQYELNGGGGGGDNHDGRNKCKRKRGSKRKRPGADEKVPRPHLSESDVNTRCFLRKNHIYFYAGVSKESVYRLQDHLITINTKYNDLVAKNREYSIQPTPIYLHINSFGGGVFAAFAAIDFIKQSALPVHTIIEGASASAATLMSIVGKRRYIRKHASMLIHQLSSWFGGKLTEIDDDYQNVTEMHQQIKKLYVQHTRLGDSELEDVLKHDRWWNADKCLETGLVDSVWDEVGDAPPASPSGA